MDNVININNCFKMFDDTYSPKIVAELNGQYLLVVKAEGDKIPWHAHDNEDEMFFIIEGVLDIHERDRQVSVKPGEFYIVRKGVEHRVVPQGLVKLLLFQPAETNHTGDVKSDITQSEFKLLF